MKFKQVGDKIIKYDFEAEYDLERVRDGVKNIESRIADLEAEKSLEDAKVTNIQELHPLVLDLKEEDVVAICLWQEAVGRSKVKAEELETLKGIVERATEELKEIESQLNIEIWTKKE